MIAVIQDLNQDDEGVTLQLIQYKNSRNSKNIIVEKSFLFKALQPGELEFLVDTEIPKWMIRYSKEKDIIKSIFKEF